MVEEITWAELQEIIKALKTGQRWRDKFVQCFHHATENEITVWFLVDGPKAEPHTYEVVDGV